MEKNKSTFIVMILIIIFSFILTSISVYAVAQVSNNCDTLSNVCIELENQLKSANNSLDIMDQKIDSYESLLLEHFGKNSSDVLLTPLYIVKEYNGIIGVFDNNGTLIQTINTAVTTLSSKDKNQLSVGLIVYSNEELNNLIDDLS